ncbi:MAG: glycosyltransferase family 2 protein [Methanobacteriota archaeon]|nr:MAG: glycosyltransferase family 2 protein [Euryarchaeota archaeon]
MPDEPRLQPFSERTQKNLSCVHGAGKFFDGSTILSKSFFLFFSSIEWMMDQAILSLYLGTIIATIYFLSKIDEGYPLKEPQSIPHLPKVSIIVPARNEAANIRQCLNSLMELHYPDYEIIVVEGNSTDETRKIVENEFPNVTMIPEPPRPNGWVGKPWACHIGQQHAKGQILLFTDADTIHHPDSLQKLVPALLTQTNGFLTIVTRQILKKFWEYTLVIVFQTIALSVYGGKGSGSRYLANGQYLMFTREAYDEIGGHQAVHDKIIEDMELASLGAAKGRKPIFFDVPELVAVRMYRTFNDFFNGFAKNLAVGASTLSIAPIARNFLLQVWAIGWPFSLLLNHPLAIPTAAFGYLSYVATCLYGQYRITRKITPHMILAPIYFIIYLFVLNYSFYLVTVKKKVKWKDISYQT